MTANKVSNAYVFDVSSDADVSIILGPPIKGHCHLVLEHFHHSNSLPKEQKDIDMMLCDLVVVAGKKGFECQRKGGSNGYTHHDRTFMKFLGTLVTFHIPQGILLFSKTELNGSVFTCLPTTEMMQLLLKNGTESISPANSEWHGRQNGICSTPNVQSMKFIHFPP